MLLAKLKLFLNLLNLLYFFITGVLLASMLQCFEIDDSGFDNHSLLEVIYLLILNVTVNFNMMHPTLYFNFIAY